MGDLLKWSAGLALFQILVLILVVEGTGYNDYTDTSQTNSIDTGNVAFNSDDVISYSDLGFLQKLNVTFHSLPWYISLLMFIPSLIGILIIVFIIRGVS